MSLTPAQIEARRGKLTASRVACLMRGDAAEIMRLYSEMIGQAEDEDLSDVWAVQLGSCTEELNLDWFERRQHMMVSRRGETVIHSAHDWAAATLDGWVAELNCPIECKHVGGREPLEVVIERYQPQLHWQMICTRSEQCIISVIMGANEPVVEFVPRDDEYAMELLKRGAQFMEFVRRRVPPVALPAVPAPVDRGKIYDMTTSNQWAASAADWLASKDAAQVAEFAAKILKEIVPADAKKCTGHGVRITVDRAGRKSLREDV